MYYKIKLIKKLKMTITIQFIIRQISTYFNFNTRLMTYSLYEKKTFLNT